MQITSGMCVLPVQRGGQPFLAARPADGIAGTEIDDMRATAKGFEARPVTLGRSDGQVSEVLSGLQAGEAYVSTNSFTLKSELGKEDAEHGH